MISAHYGMSDVFDNLVISLCKFTTLLSSAEVSTENSIITSLMLLSPHDLFIFSINHIIYRVLRVSL